MPLPATRYTAKVQFDESPIHSAASVTQAPKFASATQTIVPEEPKEVIPSKSERSSW